MYIYYNPNPKGKLVGDCVIRGVAKVTNQTWDEVYTAICLTGFDVKDMPSSNTVWADYLISKGFGRGLNKLFLVDTRRKEIKEMSLSENGNGLVMPVSPMYGNGMSNGFGFGDGSFWIIILFLFAWMGNGWGGLGGNSRSTQTVENDVQRGFDQQAVMSNLSGINSSVANGFANAEISRCNSQFNIIQSLNDMAMNMQNCCCENRAQAADLKYTIATEACADRQAVTDALRDVTTTLTAQTQTILDKMCQQEIDALKTQNANIIFSRPDLSVTY